MSTQRNIIRLNRRIELMTNARNNLLKELHLGGGAMAMMTVSTDLGVETRDALSDMAEVQGMSRAALIRQILEEATETIMEVTK